MEMKVLTVCDLEALNDAAEEIITAMWMVYYEYDNDGNYIAADFSMDELVQKMKACKARVHTHPLSFSYNEELQNISFYDAVEMPLREIKEKYLKEYLPMLRGIIRKDSMLLGYAASDEISDDYLDDLFALRWRENVKLRAYHKLREHSNRREKLPQNDK